MGIGKRGVGSETLVKSYGRGSILGLLSPIIAFAMAARGMHGWQTAAFREMERDAADMVRKGYRVVSTRESGFRMLGITWYSVTYERAQPVHG